MPPDCFVPYPPAWRRGEANAPRIWCCDISAPRSARGCRTPWWSSTTERWSPRRPREPGEPVARRRLQVVPWRDLLVGEHRETLRRAAGLRVEVRSAHPVRIDVEFHPTHHPRVLQDAAQRTDRHRRARHVDLDTACRDAESGAMNEGGLSDRRAPLLRAAGRARLVELAVVDEGNEVLSDADDVGRHPHLGI